ncbi:uncharacterized protein [Solanum lycopersicum]|uniref:uncharacterized protein n=1 Tax=Solanum lycopersicum TaxID=4081 RepID=UPI00374A617F
MNGQVKRTIHTLEDILRACVVDFKGSWDDHLPLIEFAYNNSYHSSNQMAPYKALYGHRCRSLVGCFEVGEAAFVRPDSVFYAMEKVQLIRDILKITQSSSIGSLETVAVKDSLSYEDVPVEILDRRVRRLRNKEVASVKVLWRSQSVEGDTWEEEAPMKAKYPYLYPSDSSPA